MACEIILSSPGTGVLSLYFPFSNSPFPIPHSPFPTPIPHSLVPNPSPSRLTIVRVRVKVWFEVIRSSAEAPLEAILVRSSQLLSG